MINVATTSFRHDHNTLLYGHLEGQVQRFQIPVNHADPVTEVDAVADVLQQVQVLHLHWPEWFLGADLRRHQEMIDLLKRFDVKVVWTQHNLVPHSKNPAFTAIYASWAAVADGVIHQSGWGRRQSLATYRFARHARHIVVPRPHNGPLITASNVPSRREAERQLGLPRSSLRLGIVGAPRHEKLIQLAMDAFARSHREDIQLVVYSLDESHAVPNDRRIVARPYANIPRWKYDRRLAAIDVLLLPFARSGMLVTGTVADAVGAGTPAIVSDWPFLKESLGAGGICYGQTPERLTACIDHLSAHDLRRARAALVKRQRINTWEQASEQIIDLLDRLVGAPQPRKPCLLSRSSE